MACGPPRPSGAASDVDYWLRRCQGFRVDSPDGRVGVVEEVLYASRCDRPDVIAVRAGLLGRLLRIVPVAEVAWILPGREQVVLHRSPRPTATEHVENRPEQPRAGGAREASRSSSEPDPNASRAQREVEAVITRLKGRVARRIGRGGEEEVTPDVEESAEPSAEEPSAQEPSAQEPSAHEPSGEEPSAEQAGEEPAAAEAPVEGAAETAPGEEPAPEEAEKSPTEEQTTA
jgi:hypothetical protein